MILIDRIRLYKLMDYMPYIVLKPFKYLMSKSCMQSTPGYIYQGITVVPLPIFRILVSLQSAILI